MSKVFNKYLDKKVSWFERTKAWQNDIVIIIDDDETSDPSKIPEWLCQLSYRCSLLVLLPNILSPKFGSPVLTVPRQVRYFFHWLMVGCTGEPSILSALLLTSQLSVSGICDVYNNTGYTNCVTLSTGWSMQAFCGPLPTLGDGLTSATYTTSSDCSSEPDTITYIG